ncbi:hypothetical protein GJAV_G00005400 [Gymnothorax javanicus]|nr:hypothetical protein GJAV_G00005400 [Gymnothorax javanicus]
MAAVNSPDPRRNRVQSVGSFEDDPGDMAQNDKEVCASSPSGCVVGRDDCYNRNESSCESKDSDDGAAGLSSGPTEISIDQDTNSATMVPSLVIDLTASEVEAHSHPVVSCDNQREFEWSEAEEEPELQSHVVDYDESSVSEMRVDTSPKFIGNGGECSPGVEGVVKCSSSQDTEDLVKDANNELEGKESEEVKTEVVKQRKSRLICRECGKRFTRRETFNLHRHFHTHQDELASLTCKECGLTFQHRSSLIKHRSEHKEKNTSIVLEKRINGKEGKSPQCEHCGKKFLTLVKLRNHSCLQAPEKPYRCPLCRREFQFKVSINAHMQSHSLESPFRCQECNKGFQCAVALRVHQRSHAALKPFECPECGLVFRHRSIMEDHRRKHSVEGRPHQCSICSKRFKFSSLLHQHQFLHTGLKPFQCPDCGKKFAFAQNMRAHWRQHRKLVHACPRCPLTFTDASGLKDHMQSHKALEQGLPGAIKVGVNNGEVPDRSHTCPLCPLVLPDLPGLKAHMLVHEAEERFRQAERIKMDNCENREHPRTCPHCPLVLPDLNSLKAHIVIHEVPMEKEDIVLRAGGKPGSRNTEEVPRGGSGGDHTIRKPLKCPECGKTFRHRSVLELHMRIHSRDKPFQCKVCGKCFKFSSYLQQHLIIHTGEKPFKCPDCGKAFAFHQNMKTHQRLHQQKPYRCTQCRKGYSEESELQRHMVSHTGDKPHKCQLCNKSFGLAYLLRDHLNTHTGERPHRCLECSKSFPWLSSLLVHQKIHARKRQALNQPFAPPVAARGIRGRGRGMRGRRGSRWLSAWPRWDGAPDREIQTLPSYPVGRATIPYGSSLPSHLDVAGFWGFQTPSPVPRTLSSPAKSREGQEQKLQQAPPVSWADRASSVPMSVVQQESPLAQIGNGSAVWGFQTPPSGPQTMNLPKQTGNGLDYQQSAVFTNVPASKKMGSTSVEHEESHNNYLAQKRMICERLPCPPVLPSLQPAPLAKVHQPDGSRPLPFAPNPLLQCMICGRSLPRELDLHLHYMQHAQGEI